MTTELHFGTFLCADIFYISRSGSDYVLSLIGSVTSMWARVYNMIEEPDAVVPHVRICVGAVG
jgi:hypothetical protein